MEERLELLARIIAEYLSVDDVVIFLKEPSSDELVLRISIGLDPIAIGNVRIPIGQGLTGMVAKTRKYLASKNILEDPRSIYNIYSEDEKYPSILSFPILWNEDLLGVVNIRSKVERDFSENEAEELENFTAGIAGSIKHAQEYEKLEYKANLLELSNKIAESVTSSLDLDVILDEVTWEIANGFNYQRRDHPPYGSAGYCHPHRIVRPQDFVREELSHGCGTKLLFSGEPKIRSVDQENRSRTILDANSGISACPREQE